jgi:Sap, sulfolipid-1-addressing protein
MSDAIRETLPLAIAIAVSPVPIVAIVLMLVADDARGNALACLAGWALSLVALATLAAVLGLDIGGSGGSAAVAQLVLAGILVVLIVVELHQRRREAGAPPRWLRLLDGMRPGRAFAFGIGIVVLNAKDGSLTLAAGGKLAGTDASLPAAAVALALFVVVASAGLAVPIILRFTFSDRATPWLHRTHAWLERHGSTAVLATLALLVVLLAAQGLSGL